MTVADDDPESQVTRRRVLQNDLRVARERNVSTYHQFATDEADTPRGRFTAHEQATVVGASPAPQYPEQPANSPFHHDPCGQEPPLGFSIDQMEPVGTAAEIEASLVNQFPEPSIPAAQTTDGPADAPLGGNGSPATPCGGSVSEPAGSSPSSKDEG